MERRGEKIFIVDDDSRVTKIIRTMLEIEGYQVEEFFNGASVLEKLRDAQPALMLLDIMMPGMDGIAVLSTIRNELKAVFPIIMLTGQTESVELAVDTFKHGAADYLIKPVSIEKLKTSVATALKIHTLKLERERVTKQLQEKNTELRLSKLQVEEYSKKLESANTDLREANSQLEAMFNSISNGMLTLDQSGRVRKFNKAAEAITGFSATEVAGVELGETLRASDDGTTQALAKVLAGEALTEKTLRLRTRDGSACIVLLTSNPIEGPAGSAGSVIVLQDISEIEKLRAELKGRTRFHTTIGKSRQMQQIYILVEQIAMSDASVLLEGESGTGKELIAHAIHYSSARSAGPFIKVNCSALAETLLESELFGHVKGSFTGAIQDRMGRFEAANGGTIFLDEIGDISPLIQLKLLRVIQERELERVGDTRTVKVDVRIIAATNKDLKELMEKNLFREDLYYRLKVFPIRLPPLRERKEDIPLLVSHFCERFSNSTGKRIHGGTDEAMAMLAGHPWNGNVRELENCIEHVFVKCKVSRFSVNDLPLEIRAGDRSDSTGRRAAGESSDSRADGSGTDERSRIVHALQVTGWNRTKAARKLAMGRTTLWRKMRDYGLDRTD